MQTGEDKKDNRDKGYLKIVEVLTDARKTDAAKQLIDRIADEKIKARAASMIGKRAALDGFGGEALTYLASFAGAGEDEALKAEVLVAAAANPAMLRFASVQATTLKDHMLRVRTARSIAEANFRSLDVRNLGWGKGSPGDYRAMQKAPELGGRGRGNTRCRLQRWQADTCPTGRQDEPSRDLHLSRHFRACRHGA
ncbi:hypothetical protein [Rhizobium sp. AN95]|uniref:hypothetical protein n=1 Tax=Rhizobium sp. AN95 TaxID=3035216 RepID=UPI002B25AA16|nr:hypothetical protein [Rhizobium sp. AN95]